MPPWRLAQLLELLAEYRATHEGVLRQYADTLGYYVERERLQASANADATQEAPQ
jgi:hypothetical protein